MSASVGAQLTEHDLCDMAEVILGQLVERDNLVNAVEELRTHNFFKSLHHAVLAHLRHGAAEACRRVIGLRTGVRGHNDNRVFEAATRPCASVRDRHPESAAEN